MESTGCAQAVTRKRMAASVTRDARPAVSASMYSLMKTGPSRSAAAPGVKPMAF